MINNRNAAKWIKEIISLVIRSKKKKLEKHRAEEKNIVEGKEKRGKSNDVTTLRNNRHIFVIVPKTCPIKSVP